MKKFLLLALLLLLSIPALAIPKQIYLQGVLRDQNGNLLTGSYNIVFRIYSSSTGGTALWTETHSNVSVSNGLYTVTLGSNNPLSSDVFSQDSRYVGVQVGNDPEMSPRIQLLSVPYAFNAETLDGYKADEIVSGTGGLTTAAADARYVNVPGDTMTGTLTMQYGEFRSDVGHSSGAHGFALRTNTELNNYNASGLADEYVLSVFSGSSATQPAFSVYQTDVPAQNKYYRGIIIPSYHNSPDFYILGGDINSQQMVLVGNPFMQNGITFNANGSMDIRSSHLIFDTNIASFDCHALPQQDDEFDLGSSYFRWRDVYAVKFHGDGSDLTGISAALTLEADDRYVNVTGDKMDGILTLEVYASGVYALYATNEASASSAYLGSGDMWGANSWGVKGYGTNGGVYGMDADGTAWGTLGNGGYGVRGDGPTYGVYGSSSQNGVFGSTSATEGSGYYGGYFNGGEGLYTDKLTVGSNTPKTYSSIGGWNTSHPDAMVNRFCLNIRSALEVEQRVFFDALSSGGSAVDLNITPTGEVIRVPSSRRFKKDIEDLKIDYNKFMTLRPVKFKWNEKTVTPDVEDYGLIAEDVNEFAPELVSLDEKDQPLGVYYRKVSIVLLKVVQEQQKLVETQQKQIAKLKEENEQIRAELSGLETKLGLVLDSIEDKASIKKNAPFSMVKP